MRIAASLIEEKGQEYSELPAESSSKKSSSKKNRKRQKKAAAAAMAPPNVVQKLFETCKEVFANGGPGYIPPPPDVERLRLVLDGMKPADVGLTQDLPYFKKTKGFPLITYLHLYECDNFSIGIFCLPPSGVIPLHNHPGMTVFSKLLFGSMHIKSYDWATDVPRITQENLNPTHCQPPGIRLAKVQVDSVFTDPCNTSILYPAAGGNMHCFTALTSCAVLDVLGPPYNDAAGRHCTYYQEFPYASFSGDEESMPKEEERDAYWWLEEKEKIENLVVVGKPYAGPRIVET
ncbi:hypothetical protein MKX03_008208 [Papaver bracteatum]|nr:hypothetical protein MKX03_008208 [Papaver bracteatum]